MVLINYSYQILPSAGELQRLINSVTVAFYKLLTSLGNDFAKAKI